MWVHFIFYVLQMKTILFYLFYLKNWKKHYIFFWVDISVCQKNKRKNYIIIRRFSHQNLLIFSLWIVRDTLLPVLVLNLKSFLVKLQQILSTLALQSWQNIGNKFLFCMILFLSKYKKASGGTNPFSSVLIIIIHLYNMEPTW